jgi:hypothetical protein
LLSADIWQYGSLEEESRDLNSTHPFFSSNSLALELNLPFSINTSSSLPLDFAKAHTPFSDFVVPFPTSRLNSS